MKTITITGSSDDLIKVEGDINEEFGYYSENSIFMGISDGTLLKIRYDEDGIWRIERLIQGSSSVYAHMPGSISENKNDVVAISGENLNWVLLGKEKAI